MKRRQDRDERFSLVGFPLRNAPGYDEDLADTKFSLYTSACPHGAFPLAGPDKGVPARESIDVRLLVLDADLEYPKPKPWSTRL